MNEKEVVVVIAREFDDNRPLIPFHKPDPP